jgi:hypothetical protein
MCYEKKFWAKRWWLCDKVCVNILGGPRIPAPPGDGDVEESSVYQITQPQWKPSSSCNISKVLNLAEHRQLIG